MVEYDKMEEEWFSPEQMIWVTIPTEGEWNLNQRDLDRFSEGTEGMVVDLEGQGGIPLDTDKIIGDVGPDVIDHEYRSLELDFMVNYAGVFINTHYSENFPIKSLIWFGELAEMYSQREGSQYKDVIVWNGRDIPPFGEEPEDVFAQVAFDGGFSEKEVGLIQSKAVKVWKDGICEIEPKENQIGLSRIVNLINKVESETNREFLDGHIGIDVNWE